MTDKMSEPLTLEKVAQYIEQNGLPQARGNYINYDDSKQPVSACAIGMASINSGIGWADLEWWLDNFNDLYVGVQIVSWNDEEDKSFKQIAQLIREVYSDYLNDPIPTNYGEDDE